jgi:large subunit ribosomal protein L31e
LAQSKKAPKKKKEKEEKPERKKKAKAEKKVEEETPQPETQPESAAEEEVEEKPKGDVEPEEGEEEKEETEAEVPEKEPGAVEEAAPEEEEELEIVEEKFYDLNMRKVWNTPRKKRTPRAVRFLREFIARRMKTDNVSISEEANQMLWARGISKPPRKIRVRAVKDKEGRVIVFPGEGK